MKPDVISVLTVSFLLLVCCIFSVTNSFIGLVFLITSVSPLLIVWMVWNVLKKGEYNGPELQEDEEYGYAHY